MSAVVFLGPSLDRAEAASRLDVEYLPPIKRGDIDALLARARRPVAIGIVDGAFLQGPSISPKEVLRAIDEGITVFGSSSMGALRAAECAPYGMIGVGRVFEAYHSERIDADDEVAMTYDPTTHRAVSEPLINIRFAIEAAVAAGATTASIGDRFLAIAKRLYFPDRRVKTVLRLISEEIDPSACERLQRFLENDAPDVKREDAIQLLEAMRAELAGSRTSS
ncbi:TfuA-like protein [Sorangium sp. So ce1128]|uniref:TfuA-like core domain-containing protein n=1 Tax=Sorangium cellulosum TaxID=56 RepID=A0A3S7UZS6_SORCE|nr:hypothetical protein [Sorangium cellulosum]